MWTQKEFNMNIQLHVVQVQDYWFRLYTTLTKCLIKDCGLYLVKKKKEGGEINVLALCFSGNWNGTESVEEWDFLWGPRYGLHSSKLNI